MKIQSETENNKMTTPLDATISNSEQRTFNGIPLLKEGAINVYMNMPFPLKGTGKKELESFVEEYNQSHSVKIYSPILAQGNSMEIEGELKVAQNEEEIPEILITSKLQTVLSSNFKKRFIDTGIYSAVTTPAMLAKMNDEYKELVTDRNIGIIGTGYWNLVCDLSVPIEVPYPKQWTDLTLPQYKNMISVHGSRGNINFAALLLFLKEQLGKDAIAIFGSNVRKQLHFSEILKRIDTSDPERTPFNLLPNAATAQMPAKKNAGILEFAEGPVLVPLVMYVKTSKKEECNEIIEFFIGPVMRRILHSGDFHMADEINWDKPFCFPDWDMLLQNDYFELNQDVNNELRKALNNFIISEKE